MNKIIILVFVLAATFVKAQEESTVKTSLDIKLVNEIKSLSTTWSKALKSKDVSLLENLYDENAHYLPDQDQAFHGRLAITQYWTASMDFIADIRLEMETLDGSTEMLYETGSGSASIMGADGNFFDMPFKYVDVWKLQQDGTYRVVIDTYNQPKQG